MQGTCILAANLKTPCPLLMMTRRRGSSSHSQARKQASAPQDLQRIPAVACATEGAVPGGMSYVYNHVLGGE